MPVSYYSGCLSGEKTAQLNQGVSGLSQFIKIMCNDVFATVLTAACTLVQVFINAPAVMAGIMISYLMITIIISAFQIRSQNGIREDIVSQKNALDGQICQSISNLELIRSMNAECYEKNRLRPAIGKISTTEKRHHKYMGTFDCIKQVCKIGFQVAVLLVSVVMTAGGHMNPGAVITVCLLFQQLVKPVDEVYRFMDETASSVIKAKVLAEVTDSPEDDIFSEERESCGESSDDNDIVMENVVISNPEGSMQLAAYEHLVIPGNSIAALQGKSGCGKTTTARCLNRYYPYIQGRISIFGRDIDSYTQKELTDCIYYMPQSTFFFAGSIRENLIYGIDRSVSDAELTEALKKACIYSELVKKNGNTYGILDMNVSEGGTDFSGGQRQRLSFARAFLRKPKLYIFDESTANLDENTAHRVLSNMESYASENGAGIIYISHDESVSARCKYKIVLNNTINSKPNKDNAA
jgi:ATP-binding cassette subfamily B protein